MKVDDVIRLFKETKVEEAFRAADEVDDKKEMAARLTEFAGELNYLKGLPRLTEALLKKSLLLDYQNHFTHYNLGVLYSTPYEEEQYREDLAKSERAYKMALKIKEDFHQARYNLALLYYFTGRVDEAAAEYRRITEALGDDILYRDLGVMLLEEKRMRPR
jgi:tetratricopeptide (TPR) repeat protein